MSFTKKSDVKNHLRKGIHLYRPESDLDTTAEEAPHPDTETGHAVDQPEASARDSASASNKSGQA